jgi:hypothetical protein
MKATTKAKNQPARTVNLREKLKALLERELDRLPETLEALQPKERINVVVRLMPLVLPKSKPVHHQFGEPTDWSTLI